MKKKQEQMFHNPRPKKWILVKSFYNSLCLFLVRLFDLTDDASSGIFQNKLVMDLMGL